MNMKQRAVRLVTALSVAGLISAQIPMSGGTALAADGYRNGGKFLGTSLTNEQVFTGITLGVLGYSLYRASQSGKTAASAPAASGGEMAGGSMPAPAMTATMDCPASTVMGDGSKSIYDSLSSGNYSALKGLVDGSSDVTNALSNEGPFTFLAPTNDALGKVPSDTVSMLRGDKVKLTALLEDHAILGRYKVEDLCRHGSDNFLTLSGKTVTKTVKNGKVYINGAEVMNTTIMASNGMILPLGGVVMTK